MNAWALQRTTRRGKEGAVRIRIPTRTVTTTTIPMKASLALPTMVTISEQPMTTIAASSSLKVTQALSKTLSANLSNPVLAATESHPNEARSHQSRDGIRRDARTAHRSHIPRRFCEEHLTCILPSRFRSFHRNVSTHASSRVHLDSLFRSFYPL